MNKKAMLIRLIQHYEDGNKTRFAKRLELTPQGISTWLSRGTIDYELVYAKCEHLNAAWLLTGEGSMLIKDGVQQPCEPVSASSDAVTMRLMDKLDEKDRKLDEKDILLKEKDAENKLLQTELRAMEKELATLKAQNLQHDSQSDDIALAFPSDSLEGSIQSSLPMRKPIISSEISSAGKI